MEYGEGIMKMGPFCGHVGALPGFNSAMWYLPQKDATIVVNVSRLHLSGEPAAELLALNIMKIVFPKYDGSM
jgi:D-alanyl-D-alanine carboxypeptidase